MRHALATLDTTIAVTDDVYESVNGLHNETAVPVGHAFELYCPIWKYRPQFDTPDKGKAAALAAVASCKRDEPLNQAIYARSRCLASGQHSSLSIPLRSCSALISGSGIEHPSENGFAFMRPYGVPFVPGSSIKGRLRATAEYMALFEPESGWRMVDIWWLFGWESQADYWGKESHPANPQVSRAAAFHEAMERADDAEKQSMQEFFSLQSLNDLSQGIPEWLSQPATESAKQIREQIAFQGFLNFWDMPLLKAECGADVMTPHYNEYYQGKGSPHDGSDPVPISMLVVKPGAEANLVIDWRQTTCTLPAAEALKENWQSQVNELVLEVIKWDGFGAKTAVGYGRFIIDEDVAHKDRLAAEEKQAAERAAQQAEEADRLTQEMGEEKFAIHQLRTVFEEAVISSADLITKTNQLIGDATGSWDLEDRQALHELATEIYKNNKVGKKPKQKRQALLDGLIG